MDKEKVGKKVLNARKTKGLTQAELSEVSSISIRTIQRLESGDVIPRVYTLKTLSKHLGVDLLIEAENSEEMDNKNFIHDLKWINGIKNLFNLKTYTMKKVIVLSSVLSILTIGLFAISTDFKIEKHNSAQINHLQSEELKPLDKNLPCGFYAQVVDGDTTYYGLITESYIDMKEIAPTVNYTSKFGYEFLLKHYSIVKKQLKGLKRDEYPKNFKPSPNDTTVLNEIGFTLTVPAYNYKDSCIMPVGSKSNPLVGFYFNKSFPNPIGVGPFDEKYFRDHYDLKEVYHKFINVSNLKITLNNMLIEKRDYKKLTDYEIVNLSDIRSIIVYKEEDDCEIIITTI